MRDGERADGARRRARRRARSRVWSMWSSRNPRSRSSHRGRAGERARVRARRAHGVGERDPVVVRAGEHVVDVEPAAQRARPEGRRVEARALLVGEGDHRDGRRRGSATAKPAATPSAPSKRPPRAHAVQVRAGRPPRPRRVRHRPQRAGRVALHAQPGRGRLLREPLLRRGQLRRPGQPRGAVRRRARSARGPRGGRAARAARDAHRRRAAATPGRGDVHRHAGAERAATGLWPKR